MNKYRQRIAELSKQNKDGGHNGESLVYLALADSFSPLFRAFCTVYNLNNHLVAFEAVINGLWQKWIESTRIDPQTFGKSIEIIAPNLERFTHRTACYAQDACILAHAACVLLDSHQDIAAIYYYLEPFEEVIQKECMSTLELREEKWEEDFLLKDNRVNRAFQFIENCTDFASKINEHSAESFTAFRLRVAMERWTVDELQMNPQTNCCE